METSLSVFSTVGAFFYTIVMKDKDQKEANIHPCSRSVCVWGLGNIAAMLSPD